MKVVASGSKQGTRLVLGGSPKLHSRLQLFGRRLYRRRRLLLRGPSDLGDLLLGAGEELPCLPLSSSPYLPGVFRSRSSRVRHPGCLLSRRPADFGGVLGRRSQLLCRSLKLSVGAFDQLRRLPLGRRPHRLGGLELLLSLRPGSSRLLLGGPSEHGGVPASVLTDLCRLSLCRRSRFRDLASGGRSQIASNLQLIPTLLPLPPGIVGGGPELFGHVGGVSDDRDHVRCQFIQRVAVRARPFERSVRPGDLRRLEQLPVVVSYLLKESVDLLLVVPPQRDEEVLALDLVG